MGGAVEQWLAHWPANLEVCGSSSCSGRNFSVVSAPSAISRLGGVNRVEEEASRERLAKTALIRSLLAPSHPCQRSFFLPPFPLSYSQLSLSFLYLSSTLLF